MRQTLGPGAETMQPDHLIERLQAQQMLVSKVATLADPERSVLLLRYFEGLSSTEIAEQLAMPASTVRWRLRRAIEQLRNEIDAEHPGGARQWGLLLAPISVPPKALALGTPPIMKGALLVHTAIKIGIAAVGILALYLSGNQIEVELLDLGMLSDDTRFVAWAVKTSPAGIAAHSRSRNTCSHRLMSTRNEG